MTETVITTEMYNALLRKYELAEIHIKQSHELIQELHEEIRILKGIELEEVNF